MRKASAICSSVPQPGIAKAWSQPIMRLYSIWLPASCISFANLSACSTGTQPSRSPWISSVGGRPLRTYRMGETCRARSCHVSSLDASDEARKPACPGIHFSAARSTTGLYSTTALGRLLAMPGFPSCRSGRSASDAARCPPAESPAATIRSGSIPSPAACPRTSRKASRQSATQSTMRTDESVLTNRYSTFTATKPRRAK